MLGLETMTIETLRLEPMDQWGDVYLNICTSMTCISKQCIYKSIGEENMSKSGVCVCTYII